jgi:uncharacterized membrane protein
VDEERQPQELEQSRQDSAEPAGQVLAHSASFYESHFPHPDHLERYCRLYPDAARIVFTEFEQQGEHRRRLEGAVVSTQMKNARLGLLMQGFNILASSTVTVLSALYTPPWVPVGLALIYSATVVTIFIYGKNRQAHAVNEQREAETGKG